MRGKRTPNYAAIAALEANLDPDGDGLFDGPLAENISLHEVRKVEWVDDDRLMTVREATERLERLRPDASALAVLSGDPNRAEPIRPTLVFAASASIGGIFPGDIERAEATHRRRTASKIIFP